MKSKKIILALTLVLILIIAGFIYWKFDFPEKKQKAKTGKELSKVYCASCHLYPEPKVLPKAIWQNSLLPEMKNRMGLGDIKTIASKLGYDEYINLTQKGIYMLNPMVTNEEWLLIEKHYLDNSPENAPIQIKKTQNSLQKSSIEIIKNTSQKQGLTTYFGIQNNYQLQSNILGQLKFKNLQNKKEHTIQLPSPVVEVKNNLVLCIGGNMNPTEKKLGSLHLFDETYKSQKLLIDELHRPVDFEYVDLDNDKIKDYLIAEFGNHTGQITFINGKTKERKVITTNPGARNFVLRDVNNDGMMDFYALTAQGRERISLYTNLGEGNFKEMTILEFPPYYGSSYFELADLNNDGKEEITMVNGDNADYSIVKKNFHGIRIFENQNNSWTEVYFYPVYGATNLLKLDLNNDNLIDLVSSSFFVEPEFRKSEQMIYLINKGEFKFDISHPELPEINPMTMRVGDANNDNISEIYLGNFEFQPNSNPNFNYIESIIVTPDF
ncbi:VCBS repeat-containing protein [Cellulophaga sp. HaHaR_3_176]|uniref:FG-GAP repeat domain-containing protein n=1 Tax=Cellulophaga sp. HaHaR_3_176 TaxID=1942464 RepID=UPI001C1F9095|nr:VCBS repeat-containing protein [Cellulophaga sp. HaHaR_3_176]QWX83159.1 VCBS repeat-containing protein [Cellulophaga sp. HaHaR_3_176]